MRSTEPEKSVSQIVVWGCLALAVRRSPTSRAAFGAKAERLVSQYDSYEPLPGVHLDERRSLGENLADLVGVTLALDALRLHAAETGMDMNARLDGFAAEQRFFLGWAQFWRTQTTEDALRRSVSEQLPLAGALPRQRRRPQSRRLVRGIRCRAGRGFVSTAR